MWHFDVWLRLFLLGMFLVKMTCHLLRHVCIILLLTELVEGLRDQRLADGTTDSVGEVLINWVRIPRYAVFFSLYCCYDYWVSCSTAACALCKCWLLFVFFSVADNGTSSTKAVWYYTCNGRLSHISALKLSMGEYMCCKDSNAGIEVVACNVWLMNLLLMWSLVSSWMDNLTVWL